MKARFLWRFLDFDLDFDFLIGIDFFRLLDLDDLDFPEGDRDIDAFKFTPL